MPLYPLRPAVHSVDRPPVGISLHTSARLPAPARTMLGVLTAALLAPIPAVMAQTANSVSAAAEAANFDIPAGPLERSLNAIARQGGVTLSFPPALVEGKSAPAVHGAFSTDVAFTRALQGSDLEAERARDGAYVVHERAAAGQSDLRDNAQLPAVHVSAAAGKSDAYGYVARAGSSATKTDTPLLETPQSLSVITREQMDATNATSLASAMAYTAGVISQPAGFSRGVDDFTIRGFNAAAAYGSLLRDGMKFQSNAYDGAQEPYGLERVEVLKGASSVLYGQSAPGGLINAISKRPTDTPLHEIMAQYGMYGYKELGGDFSGPVDKDGKLTYRFTAMARDAGTSIDQVPDRRVYIAPAVTWKPDAATSLTLLANYTRTSTRFASPLPASGTLYPNAGGYTIPRRLFVGETDFDQYVSTIKSAGWLFEHAFNDNVKVRQNFRYYDADVTWDYLQAGTLSNAGLLSRTPSQRHEQSTGVTADTSIEAKADVGGLKQTLLAGVDFYRRTYQSDRYTGTASSLNVLSPTYDTNVVISTKSNRGSYTQSNQVGLYLQDQIKVADRWVLLLGGRQDWVDTHTTSFLTNGSTNQRDSAFTGRAGLVYLADHGIAPYFSFSQSFVPNSGTSRTGSAFDPTRGTQYELGIRWQPPGSSTLLSAAIYQLTQKNALTTDPVDTTYSVQSGEVRSRGIELEAKTELTRNISVLGSYAYTDARTTKTTVATSLGQRVAAVPYNMFSLWVDYKLTALGLPNLRVAAGARYIGQTAADSVARTIPGYVLFDARIGYDVGNWTLSVNATNLSGRNYVSCLSSSSCRYGDDRSVIGTLAYRW